MTRHLHSLLWARTAAKAFSDRNGVVDVNHALRRLAEAKARYGMSDKELEKYLRAAPDQPGVLRAGFPFGAAFSPGRLEPWLERQRLRRQSPPERADHSVQRLADAKTRYGMTSAELEQYVGAAPDQPGLFRAGFPFGAAFSPTRVEPWLADHRRRRRSAPERIEPSKTFALSPGELATRGLAFLSTLARAPSLELRRGS